MGALTKFGIWLLEGMFVAGCCGSAVVILLAGIEDFFTLLRPSNEDTEEME